MQEQRALYRSPPALGKPIENSHILLACISNFAFTEVEKLISNHQICFAPDSKTNNAIL